MRQSYGHGTALTTSFWTVLKETGAQKQEIGGGRHNTQLVLGLIGNYEPARRDMENINTASEYTQEPDSEP